MLPVPASPGVASKNSVLDPAKPVSKVLAELSSSEGDTPFGEVFLLQSDGEVTSDKEGEPPIDALAVNESELILPIAQDAFVFTAEPESIEEVADIQEPQAAPGPDLTPELDAGLKLDVGAQQVAPLGSILPMLATQSESLLPQSEEIPGVSTELTAQTPLERSSFDPVLEENSDWIELASKQVKNLTGEQSSETLDTVRPTDLPEHAGQHAFENLRQLKPEPDVTVSKPSLDTSHAKTQEAQIPNPDGRKLESALALPVSVPDAGDAPKVAASDAILQVQKGQLDPAGPAQIPTNATSPGIPQVAMRAEIPAPSGAPEEPLLLEADTATQTEERASPLSANITGGQNPTPQQTQLAAAYSFPTGAEPQKALESIQAAEPEFLAISGSERTEMTTRAAMPLPVAADSTFHQRQLAQQIAVQISQNVGLGAANDLEIRLEPEELGSVRILMSPREGGYDVTILAERSQTLDVMRRHSDELSSSFEALGFTGSEFSFQQGERGSEPKQDPDRNGTLFDTQENLPLTRETQMSLASAISTSGRMDLRL